MALTEAPASVPVLSQIHLAPEQDFRINTEVPNEIFENHPNSAFWIGKVASMGVIDKPEYFNGLAKFRGNVYVRQLHFLSPETLDEHGCEIDIDDARSINLAIIENNPEGARVVGSGRLIAKRSQDDLLPIEIHFPEVFENKPAEINSLEVSRFIARHEDNLLQRKIDLAVIRALTFCAISYSAPTTYSVVEKPLKRLLTGIGLPVEDVGVGAAKEIPELGGRLLPVEINPYEIVKSINIKDRGTVLLRRFFEKDQLNEGQGYYPNSLTGGQSG